MEALRAEDSIELQVLVVQLKSEGDPVEHKRQSRKAGMTRRAKPLGLLVNVYGPIDRYDLVGNYLSYCSEYLQPPYLCDRNVPYRNPQSLSGRDANPPMTFQFREDTLMSEIELTDKDSDPSTALETHKSLNESGVPVAVRTVLYRCVSK